MQLKAKYIDMESSEYTVVLHIENALEIGVREQDRVRIKHERSSAVTVVQTTDTVVNEGEVGILGNAWSALGPEPDELIEVVATSKPESIGRNWPGHALAFVQHIAHVTTSDSAHCS